MAKKLTVTVEALDFDAEKAVAVLGGGKMYIVVESNWNYDDNFYYQDDGAGSIQKAFFSREAAEARREELEIDRLKGLDVWAYFGEDGPGRIGWDGAELLKEIGKIIGEERVEGIDPENFDLTLPEKLTKAQGRQLAKLLRDIAGYEVVEVPVG